MGSRSSSDIAGATSLNSDTTLVMMKLRTMITLSVTVFAMMWINAAEMRSFGAMEIMDEHALEDRATIANRGNEYCTNPSGKETGNPCQVDADCCTNFCHPDMSHTCQPALDYGTDEMRRELVL